MNQKTKCRIPIIILAVTALVCIGSSALISMVNTIIFNAEYFDLSDTGETVRLLAEILVSAFFLLINMLPCVLFVIYVTICHGRGKAAVLYPILCGLIAVRPTLALIREVCLHFLYGYTMYWRDYVLDLISSALIFTSFTLLAIQAMRGLRKKVFTIVAVSVGFLLQFLSLVQMMDVFSIYAMEGYYQYIFINSAAWIGTFLFYIVLLLFGVTNTIPPLISGAKKKAAASVESSEEARPAIEGRPMVEKQPIENVQAMRQCRPEASKPTETVPPKPVEPPVVKAQPTSAKMAPEQSLAALQRIYDQGLITEAEYRAKRAEIIDRL